jgi:hypothetical protein
VFVPECRYTLIEYDQDRPWLIVQTRHLGVVLTEDDSFTSWAARQWPPPRFKADLEPGALAPWQP